MKINLIVLPFEENVKSPPICLGYIGALIEQENEVKIIDLNFEDKIPDSNLNIVTTTTVDYYNCPLLNMNVIDKWLDKISKLHAKTAILGPHVTTIPEYFVKYADFLVIGEPEITVKELVSALNRKKSLNSIRGIYYKKGKKVIKNKPREPIKNLDDLPFPERSLMNIKQYVNPVLKQSQYTMIISSRGCPYRCTYCYMGVYGHFWRARSAENVVKELIEIRRKYNIKEIVFRDDMFSFDKKRVIEICEGILKNKLDISWSCQTRADNLNEEIIKKMRDSGCYNISLGIESGSQKILDNLRKGISLEQIKKVIALCKKYGIRIRGYFIIGCPHETIKTIEETFKFAKELDLDYFMLSIMTPYPDTPLYEEALNKKIIKERSWDEALRCAGQINTEFTFDQLLELKRKLYFRYYLRPGYIINRVMQGKFDVLFHGFFPFIRQFFKKKFRGKEL